jgi:hypothetical protein
MHNHPSFMNYQNLVVTLWKLLKLVVTLCFLNQFSSSAWKKEWLQSLRNETDTNVGAERGDIHG